MFGKILARPWYLWSGAAVLVLVAGSFWYFNKPAASDYESVPARRGDILQEVSVTGRVKPSQSVELAFERAGRAVWVGARVGDKVWAGQILVSLYNADLKAQLDEAEANLKAEEAKLAELQRGSRPEDIAIQEAKVTEVRQALTDKLRDAYTKSDDAVRNEIDQLFSSPRSSNPKLNFPADAQLASAAELKRVLTEQILNSWFLSLDSLAAGSDLELFAAEGKRNLASVREFLNEIALLVNDLKPSSSISQSVIEGYRADVGTARTNVNTAVNNLSSAESDWLIARRELALKEAGTSSEEIGGQQAKVAKARAGADNIRAQIAKTVLAAPFGGTVTRQDAKVGEIVSAGEGVTALISEAEFEIEAAVPEADLAKIKVGNSARITLDAYGSDVNFDARVVAIDPAETMVEGVATYKTTLLFAVRDERIKSGLTANVDIFGERRGGVMVVPQRAVISKDGGKFVKVLRGGKIEETKVVAGLRGSDGNIEIISGVSEGDEILIFSE